MVTYFIEPALLHVVFFFFFQAEDGIRDLTVTGVQTCALPILILPRHERALLPIRTDRLRGEELVERQWGGEPRLLRAGSEESARGLLRIGPERSEERRVGEECRSRGAPYH